MSFGLYVHWPYCTTLCPYCDFNIYRARDHAPEPLLNAILDDMKGHAARFGEREAVSLFLGGGTPSLLKPEHISRLIEEARASFALGQNAEITLECNPEDQHAFAAQAEAGINRFSIGVQALDDASLKALGRMHDAATAKHAVEAAANTGKRVSIDLIYAREGQGIEDWRRELKEALTWPIEHVSLYQLTIEPGTAFARKVERGALNPPDLEHAAAMYEVTQEVCEAAGFPAYEISNHAKSEAARAQHNLLYWRSAEWAGLGPGAHGRMMENGLRIALEAQRRPADYIDAVRETGLGVITEENLTLEQQADEFLIMGLRTNEGVDIARLNALRPNPLDQNAHAWLVEQGLLKDGAARLILTPRGRLVANQVAAELAGR